MAGWRVKEVEEWAILIKKTHWFSANFPLCFYARSKIYGFCVGMAGGWVGPESSLLEEIHSHNFYTIHLIKLLAWVGV